MIWIHWWDVRKDALADGRRLRPDSLVRLRSEHHLEAPTGYEINRLVPKFLRKWRGDNLSKVTRLEAHRRRRARLASVYWSDEWPLAGPSDQTGDVVYQPRLEGHDHSVEAFQIRCCYLFVNKVQHSAGVSAGLKPSVEWPGPSVSLGEVSGRSGSVTVFEAEAPVDPQVEISLMQGTELLDHLVAVSSIFANQDQQDQELTPSFVDTLSEAAVYFRDEPLPHSGSPIVRSLEPGRRLRIEVPAPQQEDLRTAFSVMIRDVENNYTTVTDPVFLTSVRGQTITADLPLELMSESCLEILGAVADARGDIRSLAEIYQISVPEMWNRVVRATIEAGAESVDQAVNLVGSMQEAKSLGWSTGPGIGHRQDVRPLGDSLDPDRVVYALEDLPEDIREQAKLIMAVRPGGSYAERVIEVTDNAAADMYASREQADRLDFLAQYSVTPYIYMIDTHLSRGSRPSPAKLAALARGGYGTTVNLCAEAPGGDVPQIEMAGLAGSLKTYHIPIADGTPPRLDQVIELLQLLADPATGRVYLHCEAGKARTGVMTACYRMAVMGWSPEDARLEARNFGCSIPEQLGFIQYFAEKLAQGEAIGYPRVPLGSHSLTRSERDKTIATATGG